MNTEMPFHLVKPIRGGPPLSTVYRELESSSDWMCQAKINGQRVLWDGKILWSRQGNRLNNVVSVALEGHAQLLDGELLGGKVLFVFDVPEHARKPLAMRWSRVEEAVASLGKPEVIRVCPIVNNWQEVVDNQWEGVVFKKMKSMYILGRTEGQETSDWVKFRAEWL